MSTEDRCKKCNQKLTSDDYSIMPYPAYDGACSSCKNKIEKAIDKAARAFRSRVSRGNFSESEIDRMVDAFVEDALRNY